MVKFIAEIKIGVNFIISILCDETDKEKVEQRIRKAIGTKTVNEVLDEWKVNLGDFVDTGFEFTCDGELIPK